MNKESAIQTLKRCFRDPAAVRQLAENLKQSERDGLMLMKLRERPVAYTEELALELLLLHPMPHDYRYGYYSSNGKHYVRLNEMLERGLLMRCDGQNKSLGDYYSSYVCEAVGLVADFFDVIDVAPPPALPLKPGAEAVAPVARRPGELLLRLTSFYQAIDRLDRVQMTAKGQYATPSLNKLGKLLGWSNQAGQSGQEEILTPLPSAVEFYLGLFIAADLLKVDYRAREIRINPQANIQATLELPLDQQARIWAMAYRSLTRWKEHSSHESYYYSEDGGGQTKHNALRAALLLALGLLPDAAAWYRVEDLSEALRQRIGRHFALGYLNTYSAPWKATPEQEAAARAKYEADSLAKWRKNEQVWIERALSGPLFHLGLIELARAPQSKSNALALFRLTEAGRASLHDVFRQPAETRGATRKSRRRTTRPDQPARPDLLDRPAQLRCRRLSGSGHAAPARFYRARRRAAESRCGHRHLPVDARERLRRARRGCGSKTVVGDARNRQPASIAARRRAHARRLGRAARKAGPASQRQCA